MYCKICGKEISDAANGCSFCKQSHIAREMSLKSQLTALLLCIFFGYLGIHRFYVGKVGTGVLMLLTFGGLGLWWLIDLIIIASGNFKDSYGHVLR